MKAVKKRTIILAGMMLAALMAVLLCTRSSIRPGMYVSEGTGEWKSALILKRDGTFQFVRATVLDYIPAGIYEVRNGECIATVADGSAQYVFDVIAPGKLRFALDKCSESGRVSVERVIRDGAVFERTEEEKWMAD